MEYVLKMLAYKAGSILYIGNEPTSSPHLDVTGSFEDLRDYASELGLTMVRLPLADSEMMTGCEYELYESETVISYNKGVVSDRVVLQLAFDSYFKLSGLRIVNSGELYEYMDLPFGMPEGRGVDFMFILDRVYMSRDGVIVGHGTITADVLEIETTTTPVIWY